MVFPAFEVIYAALFNKLITLLIVMLFNLLFGVILALVKKRFKWDYLTNFITSDLLPIFGWLAIGLLCMIPKDLLPIDIFTVTETAVYATVLLKIVASLLTHFAEIGILTSALKTVGVEPPKLE